MFSESNFSAADLAAVVGNNRNGSDDMWGGNGIWVILFLLLILGGRGFGFGNDGVSNGGYPTSLASSGELQRAFDNAGTTNKLDAITSELCNGFYGVNTNINSVGNALQNSIQANAIAAMQNTNNITAQLTNMAATNAQCCCENKTLIQSSFADLNYNLATQECQTRQAIADNTREVLNALQAQTLAQKDEKIAELTATVNALNLAASQQAQNNYLVNQLRNPAPIPAYVVQNPYVGYNTCNNCAFAS